MSDGCGARGDARKRQQRADEQRGLWAIAVNLDMAYPAETVNLGARMARLALAERKRQQQWASWTVEEAEKFADAAGASEDSLFVAWVRERKHAELAEARIAELANKAEERGYEIEHLRERVNKVVDAANLLARQRDSLRQIVTDLTVERDEAQAERDALRAAVAALAESVTDWYERGDAPGTVLARTQKALDNLLDDPDAEGGADDE